MNDERIAQYLRTVIFEMLAVVQLADITKSGGEEKLLREIDRILDQFGKTIEEIVPERIITDYFGGVDEANKALAAAGAAAATEAAIQNGKIQPTFQRLIHIEAVEEIIDDAMLDIAQAIGTTREASRAAILKTVDAVRSDLAAGLIKGEAQDQTISRLMGTFLDEGLTAFLVEDKNGMIRRLPLDFYAMTVVRTKTRTAAVNGSMNRYRERGGEFVRIVGNGDSCAQCSMYRDLVVSLGDPKSGYPAIGQNGIVLPPYHPNCRCGVIYFSIDTASPEELQAISEAFAEYEPGKDRRTKEEKESYEREQRGRRQANAEKKQFSRWQAALGAEAPKTLSAFRRMKRSNTIRFQELQSQYLSYAQRNRVSK